MIIGFDFDNTIVSYDQLFHRVALEQGYIPADLPPNKLSVRNYLREQNQESVWTEMQGYVYGERMLEAETFPYAPQVLSALKSKGHQLLIISHKTKHPFLGKAYDLHAAARNWINHKLFHIESLESLFERENIYFEATKTDKIARIESCACEIFIDDLPEILLAETFPSGTKRFLFDPDSYHDTHQQKSWRSVTSWQHFAKELL